MLLADIYVITSYIYQSLVIFLLTYSWLKIILIFISHIRFSALSLYEKALAYQLFPTISIK